MHFCADDYGLNDDINAAILRLGQARRLQQVSVLINLVSPAAAQELVGLHETVRIGLHLNVFSVFKPQNEIKKQIDDFITRFGFFPDFIDGHQHCHIYPVIQSALLSSIKPYNKPAHFYIRSLTLHPELIKSAKGLNSLYIKWLMLLNSSWQKKLRQEGVRTNPQCWGAFNQHAETETVLALAQKSAGPDDIFFVHPGLVDESSGLARKWDYEVISRL
ncbi:MAG: ChbG/HpnK family deacetylase [Pseudobdellovibrio sp.]